jgi:hypothetical protein
MLPQAKLENGDTGGKQGRFLLGVRVTDGGEGLDQTEDGPEQSQQRRDVRDRGRTFDSRDFFRRRDCRTLCARLSSGTGKVRTDR